MSSTPHGGGSEYPVVLAQSGSCLNCLAQKFTHALHNDRLYSIEYSYLSFLKLFLGNN